MYAAIGLYQQLGFVPAPAYDHPSMPGSRVVDQKTGQAGVVELMFSSEGRM
jgi:hypothetical protein